MRESPDAACQTAERWNLFRSCLERTWEAPVLCVLKGVERQCSGRFVEQPVEHFTDPLRVGPHLGKGDSPALIDDESWC